MNCESCGREIEAFISGKSNRVDFVRMTIMPDGRRLMICAQCRAVLSLDTDEPVTVLRKLNEARKSHRVRASR